ncbi:MAG: hypothetical protein M3265_04145, partial [Actinomycetota bacterium]|nr:hypothetical protein [Actinomycetota bacterium]
IDPLAAAAGMPLARETWDVVARVHMLSWSAAARVGARRAEMVPADPPAAVVGAPPHVVIPFWTRFGNLSLDVDQSSKSLVADVKPGEADVRRADSALALILRVPAVVGAPDSIKPVKLHAKRIGPAARAVTVDATLSAPRGDTAARFEARVPFRRMLPSSRRLAPGSWRLSATIGPSTKSLGLVLDVTPDGSFGVRSTRSANGTERRGDLSPRLVERILFDPAWRRRIPRPVRVGASAGLRAGRALAESLDDVRKWTGEPGIRRAR